MLIIIHNALGTPAHTLAQSALDALEGVGTRKITPPYMREFWDTKEPEDIIVQMFADALGEAGLRIDAIDVTFVSELESCRLKIQAGAMWRREWYAHRQVKN